AGRYHSAVREDRPPGPRWRQDRGVVQGHHDRGTAVAMVCEKSFGLLRGEREAPGIRRAKKTAKYPAHRSGKAHVLAEESLTCPADTLSPTEVEKAGVSGRPSRLIDTRAIYWGDNLEQLNE